MFNVLKNKKLIISVMTVCIFILENTSFSKELLIQTTPHLLSTDFNITSDSPIDYHSLKYTGLNQTLELKDQNQKLLSYGILQSEKIPVLGIHKFKLRIYDPDQNPSGSMTTYSATDSDTSIIRTTADLKSSDVITAIQSNQNDRTQIHLTNIHGDLLVILEQSLNSLDWKIEYLPNVQLDEKFPLFLIAALTKAQKSAPFLSLKKWVATSSLKKWVATSALVSLGVYASTQVVPFFMYLLQTEEATDFNIADLQIPGRPQPFFERLFDQSEAQAYMGFLQTRRYTGVWLDQVSIHTRNPITRARETQNVNITSPDISNPLRNGYRILAPALANALTVMLGNLVQVNDIIRETDIQNNEAANNLLFIDMEYTADAGHYRIEGGRFAVDDYAVITEPLSDIGNHYLTFIRNTLMDKLNTLGLHYQHPRHYSNSGIYVHNFFDPIYRYTSIKFYALMNAIKHNDEMQFLNIMIQLATVFNYSRREARNGFIEAYTYLYVAKKFPNEAIRKRYLHFTLRCGGIY